MNAVDEFVLYDNVEYTKKGWINRNRILVDGKDSYITLPLKKDSDYLDVRDRYLADGWLSERHKILSRVSASYRKAPHYGTVFPLVEECVSFRENNLFAFILHSLQQVNAYLDIKTPILISSSISMDHKLKSETRVIEICKARKAKSYLNPIGGVQLYSKEHFNEQGIDLCFLKTTDFSYKQFDHDFIPYLSILDVMMFNSKEEINGFLNSFYTIT